MQEIFLESKYGHTMGSANCMRRAEYVLVAKYGGCFICCPIVILLSK